MKKNQKSEIDIDHVVKLANIRLSDEEKATFQKQLQRVLAYVSKLNELDTTGVEPIGHITGLENIGRVDTPAPSLSQEEALANASKTHNGLFVVDAIFEENDQ